MINLTAHAISRISEDALKSYSNECCGFLLGMEEIEKRFVNVVLPVVNISMEDQRRRFLISPADYLYAEKFADERHLSLLGIYHSHPDHPPVPSETDRLAAQPYFSYVIVSILNAKVDLIRSWRLNDFEQFEEEIINFNN